jgi:hypothetical protein
MLVFLLAGGCGRSWTPGSGLDADAGVGDGALALDDSRAFDGQLTDQVGADAARPDIAEGDAAVDGVAPADAVALPSQLSVSPPSIMVLGPVPSGCGPSGEGAVRVTNAAGAGGSAPLQLRFQSSSSRFMLVDDGCSGKVLPPGGQCEARVRFAPVAVGAVTDTLLVEDADRVSRVALTAEGFGVDGARLAPTMAIFGATGLLSRSAPVVLTLHNSFPLAIIPDPASLGSTEFVVTKDGCVGRTLPTGGTCPIEVVFQPTMAGDKATPLQVTWPGPCGGTVQGALTGSGLGGGDVWFTPGSWSFGQVPAGQQSPKKTFTFTNAGQLPLGAMTIDIQGTNSDDFKLLQESCSAGLAPGATCTVEVAFAPRAAAVGVRNASLVGRSSEGIIVAATLQGLVQP